VEFDGVVSMELTPFVGVLIGIEGIEGIFED
jgi:hypothetical protein